MNEHEDRESHEAKADELERELDDMRERTERLGSEIESTDEAWERRKKDEGVPGATGEQDDDGAGDEDDIDTDELDFGRDLGSEAVVAEDGPPSDDDSGDDESGS